MFGKGKKKPADSPQSDSPETSAPSRLRELCGPDDEMYAALSRLLLVDPKKILSPLDSILTEAQDSESKGDKLRAQVGYRVAGCLSLWKLDSDGVKKYFAKASSLANEGHPEYSVLAKRADEAIGIARKYYETSNQLFPAAQH